MELNWNMRSKYPSVRRKERGGRKAAIGILIFGAVAAVLIVSRIFILNTSGSVPVGLWRRVGGPPRPGDVVEVPFEAFRSTDWVPEAYRRENECGRVAPYLKRVAALGGDWVEEGDRSGWLRVAGNLIPDSAPLSMDRAGNEMRAFPLPLRLASDEVWLLSDSPRGFDSRYLGPARLSQCVRVTPLLVFGSKEEN